MHSRTARRLPPSRPSRSLPPSLPAYLSNLVRVHGDHGGGGHERRDLLLGAAGQGLVHLLEDVQTPLLGLRKGPPQQGRREAGALDVQLERRDAWGW